MAEFTLSGVTIPTPAPYDEKEPTQQLENLCYVALQILQGVKSVGFTFGDVDQATKDGTDITAAIAGISLSVSPTDLTTVVEAIQDLKFNGETLDLGPLKITFTGKQITALIT